MNAHSDPSQRARRYVHALRGFYLHLIIYGLVNGGLFLMNLVLFPRQLWSLWSVFGWGIGVLAHGASVFLCYGQGGILNKEWEEQKMREYLARDQR